MAGKKKNTMQLGRITPGEYAAREHLRVVLVVDSVRRSQIVG